MLSTLFCLGLAFPKGFGNGKDRHELGIVCYYTGRVLVVVKGRCIARCDVINLI